MPTDPATDRMRMRNIMAQDVIKVNSTTVACEGNGPVTGHPKVYLTFKSGATEIVCPYCSQTFVLAEGAKADAGH
jgi:uncharacterized Zn-finger protein